MDKNTTLYKILKKDKMPLVLGLSVGVLITSASFPDVHATNVRSKLSSAVVPNEATLNTVTFNHMFTNTQSSLLESMGYDDLIHDASALDTQYKDYVKECKRQKRLAELRAKREKAKKLRLEEEKRKAQEQAETSKTSSKVYDTSKASLPYADNGVSYKGKKYTDWFEITAYCQCQACCGKYSPEVTGKVSHTASGTVPKAGRTIAVDPDVIPLGSTVVINGHAYIAEDTGSAVQGNIIDVFFDNHEETEVWGRRRVKVTYYIK